VHCANALSKKHLRSQICDNCAAEPASFRCSTDGLVLCQDCDWDAHGSRLVAAAHDRCPVDSFSGVPSAFELAAVQGDVESVRIEQLSQRLREGLLALPGVTLNGCAQQRIAHTLNLCISRSGFNSAQLAGSLALSSTSACNSASNAPSHVLLALGLDAGQALSSVRVSVGRYTEMADVERAIEVFRAALQAPAGFW